MRPTRALIDLNALRHNYRLARQRHGGQALAVIKANAYGHGAVRCAEALTNVADAFAVAFLDEALSLHQAGITRPILVLEGFFNATELHTMARLGLWAVVHHEEQLRLLESTSLEAPLNIWLKMNSGMNRAGFDAEQMRMAHERLVASGKALSITLMTHFARADEPDCDYTREQIERFDAATHGLPGARSLCNSAGVLAWPHARRDWSRPGILLYGADPMPGEPNGLQPVMTLQSTVMAVREIPVGAPLGYGARFHAARPTRVGLVAIGYADGYPRTVPDGTPVAVDDKPAALIGRVSMDMLTVDLTDLPQSGIGSRVELWGKQIPVGHIATAANTIAYELLCNAKRVKFEYHG